MVPRFRAGLRSEGERSTIVIGNCADWTDNGGSPPSESCRLYAFVDPVSAPHSSPMMKIWWSRRVPPPGPIRLFRAPLSPYFPKELYWKIQFLSRISTLNHLFVFQP